MRPIYLQEQYMEINIEYTFLTSIGFEQRSSWFIRFV